jgi:hypothetical protein
MGHFFEAWTLASNMELWNSGILEGCFLKRILFIFSFSSTQILPSTQHRIIPELIIPPFQLG